MPSRLPALRCSYLHRIHRNSQALNGGGMVIALFLLRGYFVPISIVLAFITIDCIALYSITTIAHLVIELNTLIRTLVLLIS
jgi:hypothetical protein